MSLEDKVEDFDLKDVIDFLTDYNLTHVPYLFDKGGTIPLLGDVDFDNRVIHIAQYQDLTRKRKTIIHEFLHLWYRVNGKKATETTVVKQTEIMFKQLYESH